MKLPKTASARLKAWRHAAMCEAECREGLRGHIIGLLRESLASKHQLNAVMLDRVTYCY